MLLIQMPYYMGVVNVPPTSTTETPNKLDSE